ncbi:hypothetical protein [Pseudomonas lundensis]|uniref:hypothetical protein n=1 Tax=Pseudomonas lundensis TaxID=86185 RepID=UPI001472D28A|nr:hypothetical protein [Pseudomonas lundensis]NNA31036.1 hypothetical protein [Pseudomonas lundensis]
MLRSWSPPWAWLNRWILTDLAGFVLVHPEKSDAYNLVGIGAIAIEIYACLYLAKPVGAVGGVSIVGAIKNPDTLGLPEAFVTSPESLPMHVNAHRKVSIFCREIGQ